MIDNSVLLPVGPSPGWLPGRCRFLGTNRRGDAVLMPLDLKSQGPRVLNLDMLERALIDQVVTLATHEPLRQRCYDDLSDAEKAYYDKWKNRILPVIQGDSRLALLESAERARIITRLAAATNTHPNGVRRVLYSVLRAGCSLRGIMPDLYLRGGPGKPQAKGTARRGRKAMPGGIRSEVALPEIRRVLEDAVEEYVVKNGDSVPVAFRNLIGSKFSDVHVEPNGKVTFQQREEIHLPTIAQLRHIAKVHEGVHQAKLKVAAPPRPGKAKDDIPGPGYLYEIDASGARLELVSEFDLQQAIGSANVYGVLDVWSTVCVGGVLGVFNAGYEAAQRALFNAFTSKRELCARYDIEISDDFWPCHHVPRKVLGDRGEIASEAAEALPEELNVVVLNAAAWRPQMKGTVERWFHTLKSGDLRRMVGYGRRPERGELDPRRRAALTRYDGMRVFLILAIQYNYQPAPVEAIPPAMLAMGYEKIARITLWQWGMKHCVSGARIEDPGVIYTSLLRKTDAAIREDGLYVRGVRYMAPELRASGLLQRASASGAIAAQATIDNYAARTIWYRTAPDAPWLPATLADQKIAAYDATFTELSDYYRQRNNVHARSAIASAALSTHLCEGVIAISRDAVARQGGPVSLAGSKGMMRGARGVDAESERREHGAAVIASYVSKEPAQAPAAADRSDAADEADRSVAKSRLALTRGAFLGKGGGNP